MILKKKFLQALVGRKKLHTAQMQKKKILALLQARKKMLQRYFIIPERLYKIAAKLQPFQIICKPASHSC